MATPSQQICSAAAAAAPAIDTSHPLSFDEMENEIIQALKKIYLEQSSLTSKDITKLWDKIAEIIRILGTINLENLESLSHRKILIAMVHRILALSEYSTLNEEQITLHAQQTSELLHFDLELLQTVQTTKTAQLLDEKQKLQNSLTKNYEHKTKVELELNKKLWAYKENPEPDPDIVALRASLNQLSEDNQKLLAELDIISKELELEKLATVIWDNFIKEEEKEDFSSIEPAYEKMPIADLEISAMQVIDAIVSSPFIESLAEKKKALDYWIALLPPFEFTKLGEFSLNRLLIETQILKFKLLELESLKPDELTLEKKLLKDEIMKNMQLLKTESAIKTKQQYEQHLATLKNRIWINLNKIFEKGCQNDALIYEFNALESKFRLKQQLSCKTEADKAKLLKEQKHEKNRLNTLIALNKRWIAEIDKLSTQMEHIARGIYNELFKDNPSALAKDPLADCEIKTDQILKPSEIYYQALQEIYARIIALCNVIDKPEEESGSDDRPKPTTSQILDKKITLSLKMKQDIYKLKEFFHDLLYEQLVQSSRDESLEILGTQENRKKIIDELQKLQERLANEPQSETILVQLMEILTDRNCNCHVNLPVDIQPLSIKFQKSKEKAPL